MRMEARITYISAQRTKRLIKPVFVDQVRRHFKGPPGVTQYSIVSDVQYFPRR